MVGVRIEIPKFLKILSVLHLLFFSHVKIATFVVFFDFDLIIKKFFVGGGMLFLLFSDCLLVYMVILFL